ncbi:TRAP transporter substrate-binding protein [Clostridium sp. AN503]|uniref:TRAP transporter substrate-binding protein n=1 Tax=Clostridium sp. AN503 TaxID=3160598 RepID=UPI0034585B1A
MKKKLLALTVVSALAVSLAGCGGGSTAATTAAAKAPEATTAAGAAADTTAAGSDAAAAPEIVLKYAELNSDDNINTRVGYEFAKYVDEMSNGRIKIEVYSSSTLGDEKTCLNALQMGGGTVDMYRGNTNSLSDYGFQKLNMFGLPFIFTGRDGMWKVLEDEELGQAFLTEGSEVGAGMVGLFYTDEGARNMFTTKEIKGLGDIKSMKIRVPETQLMMDTMKALGAEPTPISYSELYSSLQSGVVDGAENGYPGYASNKFYEVAPYYLLSGHTFSPGIVLMAEAKWNALSPEDQQILLDAGQKASDWNKGEIDAEEEVLRKDLEDKGVTIIDMTPEDTAAAQAACEPVWADYSKGIEDLLTKMVEIQK